MEVDITKLDDYAFLLHITDTWTKESFNQSNWKDCVDEYKRRLDKGRRAIEAMEKINKEIVKFDFEEVSLLNLIERIRRIASDYEKEKL